MEEDRGRHPRPRSPNSRQHHPHLRDKGRPALGALRWSSAPLTPRSWASGLHNHHRIISGVLSHPVYEFATAASTTARDASFPIFCLVSKQWLVPRPHAS